MTDREVVFNNIYGVPKVYKFVINSAFTWLDRPEVHVGPRTSYTMSIIWKIVTQS